MDDDIPELEDIPNIEEITLKHKKKVTSPETKLQSVEPNSSNHTTSAIKDDTPVKTLEKPVDKSFGGFKKGFLNNLTTVKAKSKNEPTDMIHIKTNPNKSSESKIFADVKAAVQDSTPEWINDDFLEKIEKNEKLLKGFQNTRLLGKVAKFQKNPQEALKECANDKEAQDFLMEFMKLMGTHLTSDQFQDQSQSPQQQQIVEHQPQDKEVMKLLENSEIKELLMDSDVQNLFQELRENPEKGNSILKNARGPMQVKIKKLISFGLLGVQG